MCLATTVAILAFDPLLGLDLSTDRCRVHGALFALGLFTAGWRSRSGRATRAARSRSGSPPADSRRPAISSNGLHGLPDGSIRSGSFAVQLVGSSPLQGGTKGWGIVAAVLVAAVVVLAVGAFVVERRDLEVP